MKKTLSKFRPICLDTNIFAYYFNRESVFHARSEKIFSDLVSKSLLIVTSILTLTELLSYKANEEAIERLKSDFLSTPNLTIVQVDMKISEDAARIRRKYGFRLPDAIQLATALDYKAQTFITNDKRLKVFKELPITLLTEI